MTSAITITVSAHWIGRWFVYPLARAFVVIDDVEHQVKWSSVTRFAVDPGEHMVAAGIRYRGIRSKLLGVREVPVRIGPGEKACLHAINGPTNGEPFYVTVVE